MGMCNHILEIAQSRMRAFFIWDTAYFTVIRWRMTLEIAQSCMWAFFIWDTAYFTVIRWRMTLEIA